MFALPDHGDLAGNNIPNATRTKCDGLVTLKWAATRRRLLDREYDQLYRIRQSDRSRTLAGDCRASCSFFIEDIGYQAQPMAVRAEISRTARMLWHENF